MNNSIISAISAAWILLIALISVQNATVVSIKFLFWQSIELPWGLILASAVSIGFLLGGWLSLLSRDFNHAKHK
jgi:uncharacterized integral membrane protein